jgi:ribosome-associated protein
VLVDCGEAVVHILQPTFRAYYNLEEIWGGKPVRLKPPAPAAGAGPAAKKTPRKTAAKAPTRARAKSPSKAPARAVRRRAA